MSVMNEPFTIPSQHGAAETQPSSSIEGSVADFSQMLQNTQTPLPTDVSAAYFPELDDSWAAAAQRVMAGYQWGGGGDIALPVEMLGGFPNINYNTLSPNIPPDDLSPMQAPPMGQPPYLGPLPDRRPSQPTPFPPHPTTTTTSSSASSQIPSILERRQSISESSTSQGPTAAPPRRSKSSSRRASHNLVEKRYRINLNSKFRKLEEVVMNGTEPGGGGGATAAQKSLKSSASAVAGGRHHQSPKASIIDSALGYIENLQSEIGVLKGKLDLTEKPCRKCVVSKVQSSQAQSTKA